MIHEKGKTHKLAFAVKEVEGVQQGIAVFKRGRGRATVAHLVCAAKGSDR